MKRNIVFITGTRADYSKIKSLIKKVSNFNQFEVNIFVTGMHMLSKYGLTYQEIEKDGFINIYKYINSTSDMSDRMDITLSNTILGFSNYISEIKPDLIIVHGDRIESLAATIVGSLNNIKVMHIEGGEVSGTIDESVRHSITKLSHFHLVANEQAKKRIIQLGEKEETIFVFGSADIDIMYSKDLPKLEKVKEKYQIYYDEYAILIYHPVTTELEFLEERIECVVNAILSSDKNYIIIYPNNDNGSNIILKKYSKLKDYKTIKIYPSMRFEYFLTLLKNSKLIIGNSSCGIREAGVYGIPTIDIGNRQSGRYDVKKSKSIFHINENETDILKSIKSKYGLVFTPESNFGKGNSDEIFINILKNPFIWNCKIQKKFNDIDF